MKEFLTKEQRTYFVRTHKREQNKKTCDRIKAVLLCDSGYTYSEISRILLLDDETIRRHVEDYCTKLKIKPENGGSESKLTEEEAQALITHLHEVTYLYVKVILPQFSRHVNLINYESLKGEICYAKQRDLYQQI